MLDAARDLSKYSVYATDGHVGSVSDLYFDDESWRVRYLVVKAGSLISNRKVLVFPGFVSTGAVSIGFAIPSATATDVADQIIDKGSAHHPYLGVSLVNLTPEIARRFDISVEFGAIITSVDPNGPAAEAGIEPGGVITATDSERIANSGDLLAALRGYQPGDSVEMTVAKDGEARDYTVDLGERRE